MFNPPHSGQMLKEEVNIMREEYDFSKSKKNPYAAQPKKPSLFAVAA
jgi:hypothetical protein